MRVAAPEESPCGGPPGPPSVGGEWAGPCQEVAWGQQGRPVSPADLSPAVSSTLSFHVRPHGKCSPTHKATGTSL